MQVNPKEGTAIDHLDLARIAARAAIEKKADGIAILDVHDRVSYCDTFLLCNGASQRQVRAIAQHILATVKAERGMLAMGVEGLESGRWVLIDLGELVVHVFQQELRGYYDLDALWVDAPRIALDALGLGEVVPDDELGPSLADLR